MTVSKEHAAAHVAVKTAATALAAARRSKNPKAIAAAEAEFSRATRALPKPKDAEPRWK